MSQSRRLENAYRVRLIWKNDSEAGDLHSLNRNHTVQNLSGGQISVQAHGQSGTGETGQGSTSPEELFLASISSCLMLTFLDLCRKNAFRIISYEDDCQSFLARDGEGILRVSRIHLKPRVLMLRPELENWKGFAVRLFHEAHYYCYLINSIRSPVDLEPLFVLDD